MLYMPLIISIIEVLIVTVPVLLSVAFVTIAERKTMASMQRRLGPNITGYYGLLQAFADALKLLLKEYVSPTQANAILFFLGPIITLIFSLLGYAVIPFGPGLSIWDFNLGILYMLAVSSLSTYGILLAGFYYTFSPLKLYQFELTLGEFQEKLIKLSELEAKHFYNVRSTTSWWLSKTLVFRLYRIISIWVRYLATSAQNFVGYSNNNNKNIIHHSLKYYYLWPDFFYI